MKIGTSVIWRGRTGSDKTYFHPRATKLGEDGRLMMTLQEITGSDYFHPVAQSFSDDDGTSWSDPSLVPGLGWKEIEGGISEGICDVVPDYHAETDTILAIGHNVYYRDGRLYDSLGNFRVEDGPRLQRFPAYNVMDADGNWLPERKKLICEELLDCSVYSCGCSQKVIFPDGKLSIPITYGRFGRKDLMVTSLLCDFDGVEISVLQMGRTLELPVGRGLMEPSIICFEKKFFMTIRAEDNHGHVAASNDGLEWESMKAWAWEDGELLTMSTTQQHWLKHDNKLYLVYNRKAEDNADVIRWRAPLYIAEVDLDALCLKKDSERIVFPIDGDAVEDPRSVPLMGNFHPLEISDAKGIVTVGDTIPGKSFIGDTLIALLE